jgi:TetR/AcrR family transcriptional regulator
MSLLYARQVTRKCLPQNACGYNPVQEKNAGMGKIRDSARTRQRIVDAAAREFSEHGFGGTTVSTIARRSKLSKQLIHHHFRTKEKLFQEVHDVKFRPRIEIEELLPPDPADLIAERFEKHAGDVDYIRFLTWEAASGRPHAVPGHAARQRRIADYAAGIRKMQTDGRLRADLNPEFIQLAVLALSTYPVAFGQITRLVTGLAPANPRFRREWHNFLRQLGQYFLDSTAVEHKRPARAARHRKDTQTC